MDSSLEPGEVSQNADETVTRLVETFRVKHDMCEKKNIKNIINRYVGEIAFFSLKNK